MFNRKKCRNCKYHMAISGAGYSYQRGNTMCGYSLITKTTCLRLIDNEIYDMRGDDPENCLLFNTGDADEHKKSLY